ncbi:MAG TPA: hypothetical protein VKR31_13870, partial [Rhizomicrobium sp.]|nr:hypothetical protein [Rhizomicrobium sp.]
WTIVRGQLGTTAAAHILGAAVTVAQTSATDSPISNVDIGDLGVSDPVNAIANYIPGQGNDIGPLQGVDWQATQVKIPNGGALTYYDEFPQSNFIMNQNDITSVTYSTSTPPFKAKCQRWYNTIGPIFVRNGTGIHNTGGNDYRLTSGGYGEWCFDPSQQALYQLRGSAN